MHCSQFIMLSSFIWTLQFDVVVTALGASMNSLYSGTFSTAMDGWADHTVELTDILTNRTLQLTDRLIDCVKALEQRLSTHRPYNALQMTSQTSV